MIDKSVDRAFEEELRRREAPAPVYEDKRGWRYKVVADVAGEFSPRCQKPGEDKWKYCWPFDPVKERSEAEAVLRVYAGIKGMREVEV